MELILLIVHLFLAMALVGVILLQKSEGGALGMGGGGAGSFLSARGAANLLTRTTAILAGLFIITSLSLALIASHKRTVQPRSIVDPPGRSGPATPGPTAPAPATPAQPAQPATPDKK
jgi:preprotein translocase subunit SecG